MRRVGIFFSASAAERLTAVVVLPTPPFWLAMVKTVVRMKRPMPSGDAGASASAVSAHFGTCARIFFLQRPGSLQGAVAKW